jgi:hypothetical protein
MEDNLRPMTLGEILDRTAQLYRSNFLLFAGIFSVYAGVATVLGLLQIGLTEWLKHMHLAEQFLWVALTAAGVEWLLLFLLVGAAVAAISRAVAWVHLGQPASIRGAYASVLPRLGRYLWLMTVTAFVVWTPLALVYGGYMGVLLAFGKRLGAQAGGVAAANIDPNAATVAVAATGAFLLLLVPALIYTILMGLRYALALPACVVENLSAFRSLRRGIDLSKGARGRIFVLGLLVGAVKLALVLLTQVFVIVAAFKHRGELSSAIAALSQVVSFFTTAVLGPIYATGITLLYYDQRVRREGYDIEWMMLAAGLTPTPQPQVESGSASESRPTPEAAGIDEAKTEPEGGQS